MPTTRAARRRTARNVTKNTSCGSVAGSTCTRAGSTCTRQPKMLVRLLLAKPTPARSTKFKVVLPKLITTSPNKSPNKRGSPTTSTARSGPSRGRTTFKVRVPPARRNSPSRPNNRASTTSRPAPVPSLDDLRAAMLRMHAAMATRFGRR